MRKLLIAIPLAATMLFGGCVKTPTGDVDIIKSVQNITVQACLFLPTASTVAAILTAGNPAFVTAQQIAEAICNSVKPLASRGGAPRGAYVPTVAGVVVHGKFVR